jgi:RNA polymerase sigma-70 factor (ECF subfamily)
MAEPMDLLDLIRGARAGDEAASTELVRRFEPFIQRVVRLRMRHRGDYDRLRHEVGCSDVCQSVFKSLFRGLRDDRYHLDQPGDLERLLQTMVRFHLATKGRRAAVKLRELIGESEQGAWPGSTRPPDQVVADRDLVEAIQERFARDELELLLLWLDDTPWSTVGEKLGCTPDAARVRLSRAFARVRMKLGVEGAAGA